ncbi:serine/threonine protein phosphatase [Paramagnetospirillum marisnigri]|uniref:Serine/threonine protein phosphatase n=1 Tax=Paramagnetospirillum marisnigri TaxID=1285242 RepID=A0A178MQP9_9PROT|nr:serine/threonine protein phosphatase [Paramagnetospirillum marisnigri]
MTRSVGVFEGLSFKQAVATLVIALTLGLVAGAWDLMADYRRMRQEVTDATTANLALVRGLAVEAAFLLSADLAGEVANGLMQDPVVAEVRLVDNFGDVLGRKERPGAETAFPELAQWLFGDFTSHSLLLKSDQKGTSLDVGRLDLRLDPGRLMSRYISHIASTAAAGAARTVLLCLLVVAVFYVLITKPLLKISAAIGKVDPERPGDFLIAMPPRHQRDELGLLASTVNALLDQTQRGLRARDAAEAELAALARDLEQRVVERTAELAQEKEVVERANMELEKASRFISDGIRYASRIQTALLPDPATLSGSMMDFAVGWHPFEIVGGDYYWAGKFGDKTVVTVMDCTGHGVPGAFMTAVVSSILARVLHHHQHEDPAAILALLNTLVKSALRQDRADAPANDGLDAAICVVDHGRRILSFAGANQPLLIWSKGEMKLVQGDRCSLGYCDSPAELALTRHDFDIAEGDTFYLYTDGLVDQMGGPSQRLFGRRRLLEALSGVADLPLEQQKEKLFALLAEWRGGQALRDDTTFVAFRPRL